MFNKRLVLVMGVGLALAGAAIQEARLSEAATPTKAAHRMAVAPEARRRNRMGVTGFPQRMSRKKLWTCVAIEKRKAAKRRNVIRARRRA